MSDSSTSDLQKITCGNSICCDVINWSVDINGLCIYIFKLSIQLVTIIFLGVLIFTLRVGRKKILAPYFNWVALTICVFFLIEFLHMIPFPNTDFWLTVLDYVDIITLTLQWYIQIGIVIFMYQIDISKRSEKKTFFVTVGYVSHLTIMCTLGAIFDFRFWSLIISELSISLFMLTAIILHYYGKSLIKHWDDGTIMVKNNNDGIIDSFLNKCKYNNLADRPAVLIWCYFQLTAHVLFGIQFSVSYFYDSTDWGICLAIGNDVVYYTLITLIFYWTILKDSRHWTIHGAFLLSCRDGLDNKTSNYIHNDTLPLLNRAQYSDSQLSNLSSDSSSGSQFSNLSWENDSFTSDDFLSNSSNNVSNINIISQFKREGIRVIKYEEISIDVDGDLGEGVHGEVFKGKWRGTTIAIKRFKARNNIQGNKYVISELFKEAQFLNALRHPNVVLLLGVVLDTKGNNYCIITEFLCRGSIFDAIHVIDLHKIKAKSITLTVDDKKKLVQVRGVVYNWKVMIKIALDIARGMLFLHSSNPRILHRDLKSQNVLLDLDYTAKVCDFSISRELDVYNTMTRVGTPQWMSPEVLRNERYSEKADVFSFGVILWELCTRKVPFAGVNPLTVISLVGHQKKRNPIPTQGPEEILSLIKDCWEEDPDKRPCFNRILNRLESLDPDEIQKNFHQLKQSVNYIKSNENLSKFNNKNKNSDNNNDYNKNYAYNSKNNNYEYGNNNNNKGYNGYGYGNENNNTNNTSYGNNNKKNNYGYGSYNNNSYGYENNNNNNNNGYGYGNNNNNNGYDIEYKSDKMGKLDIINSLDNKFPTLETIEEKLFQTLPTVLFDSDEEDEDKSVVEVDSDDESSEDEYYTIT